MATEIEVEDEIPPAPDNTVVVVDTGSDSTEEGATALDVELVTRVTRLEDSQVVQGAAIEALSQLVNDLSMRMDFTNERVTETQEAVIDTQAVVAEAAEATPTPKDDEVIDEAPKDTKHWFWK